jgi:hypothetical protein
MRMGLEGMFWRIQVLPRADLVSKDYDMHEPSTMQHFSGPGCGLRGARESVSLAEYKYASI